ncbi:MAG: competence/damage-inducible protein A [Clostridiales Family XIII bacterium]|jgi:nicotinamide-nucleotide amidase|nr:competence/damage-inducible protein A [Clostridiales Family XIII bacterium]
MKATIISVGTELLFGQTTDTNSVYLSRQLQLLGIDVMYHHTVGDNAARFRRILELSYDDCDLVVTTGGLGPTQDDLTKETVAEALGDALAPDPASLASIEAFFARIGREMTDNNRKQALLPSKADIFPNREGTAPGFALETGGRAAVCLPGPPREMTAMFERSARPWLAGRAEGIIYHRTLRTFGIGESALEAALEDLISAQTDPTLATYAKEGECSLRIASKRADAAEAQRAVAEMQGAVMDRIGRYVYSDSDEELAQVVAGRLIERGLSISSAESCTGGMFAAALTDIPGISAVFDRGIVAYSDRAKTEELGVPRETIERHGAVSRETALAMARGLKALTGSRVAVSVTGIAGPEGATDEKPVGLAHMACVFDDRERCEEIRTRNVSRVWNRRYAVLHMLSMLLREISD